MDNTTRERTGIRTLLQSHRHVNHIPRLKDELIEAAAVKYENFKTCAQSGFCKRNRAYADQVGSKSGPVPSYELDPASIKFKSGILTGTVHKQLIGTSQKIALPLVITFLESGSARVTLDEERRQRKDIVLRHDSKARKERYNEAEKWAIVGDLQISKAAATDANTEQGTTRIVYGKDAKLDAIIKHAPFSIDFRRDGEVHVQLNDRGLLNYEHWRPKIDKPVVEAAEGDAQKVLKEPVDAEDESTWWDEAFGGSTDSKPRGPESVAMDISFPGYQHVYGIAGHSGPLSLRQTRYASSLLLWLAADALQGRRRRIL